MQGLHSSASDPPALWAVEELTAPLAERLHHHFVGNPNTDRMEHPEWLFETVRRIAGSLAPQLAVLAPCLTAHELQSAYHLPFEFVRALCTALQVSPRPCLSAPAMAACGPPHCSKPVSLMLTLGQAVACRGFSSGTPCPAW